MAILDLCRFSLISGQLVKEHYIITAYSILKFPIKTGESQLLHHLTLTLILIRKNLYLSLFKKIKLGIRI